MSTLFRHGNGFLSQPLPEIWQAGTFTPVSAQAIPVFMNLVPFPAFLSILASPLPADPPELLSAGEYLEVKWETLAGHSYSLQQAENLNSWETLPYVFAGTGERRRFRLPPPWPRRFVRLRSSPHGDTDDDLLPDAWEWRIFGDLNAAPGEDPDGDGRSNLQEYREGTPPRDFYNGLPVRLELHGDSSPVLAPGTVSGDALFLSLRTENDEPMPSAPVRFFSFSGEASFYHEGSAHAELTLFTDANGEIQPASHNLRLRAPEEPGTIHRLLVQAGAQRREIQLRVGAGDTPGPPRQLRRNTH